MRLLCIFTSWKTAGAGAGLCFYPALRFPWLHPAVPGRLGTGWQGQEGSQRAGEVAERPPQRTLQLAAAVISTAGSRRGRAPEGFGRSPNPRRLRDGARRREGTEPREGRDGGICHPQRPPPAVAGPPQPRDAALGSLELLMGLGWFGWSCCSSLTWGRSPQQFQLGWEQGATSPVLGTTQ